MSKCTYLLSVTVNLINYVQKAFFIWIRPWFVLICLFIHVDVIANILYPTYKGVFYQQSLCTTD